LYRYNEGRSNDPSTTLRTQGSGRSDAGVSVRSASTTSSVEVGGAS
jgi:hypothetical protein